MPKTKCVGLAPPTIIPAAVVTAVPSVVGITPSAVVSSAAIQQPPPTIPKLPFLPIEGM